MTLPYRRDDVFLQFSRLKSRRIECRSMHIILYMQNRKCALTYNQGVKMSYPGLTDYYWFIGGYPTGKPQECGH